jgi:xanthine dehydrogenase YagS FAD-binding subunit
MQPFTYLRVNATSAALQALMAGGGAAFIAGGTDLLQLLKDDIQHPRRLVDINALPLADIEVDADGARLGALARMSDVADHPRIIQDFPAVSQALLLSASPQLRNMASIGGNLLQRTQCAYFRDPGFDACNKRRPGSGCAALEGENRMHVILGGSEACVATHASDLAVALVALDAVVHLVGPDDERHVALEDFHTLPGQSPEVEHVLRPGELIVRVDVPHAAHARRSVYLKVRDRASYEFALTSAAVGLDIRRGRIRGARVAMGGVGTRPWRMRVVEELLVDAAPTPASWAAAAELAMDGAHPLAKNTFKVELAKRTLVRALSTALEAGA